MQTFAEKQGALQHQREATLLRIGDVSPGVLSRTAPIFSGRDGSKMSFWPGLAIGRQRIVRRRSSVMVVTDGISDPWDSTLHEAPVDWTFDFELAVEVPVDHLPDPSDAGIAASWVVQLVWAATDWIVAEQCDLKGRVGDFACVTVATPEVAGLENFVADNGSMGVLVGIPLLGTTVGPEAVLATRNGHDAVWLLTAKLLLPEEYEYASGVPDASRTLELAEAFITRGDGHLSWPDRTSILPTLGIEPSSLKQERKWCPRYDEP